MRSPVYSPPYRGIVELTAQSKQLDLLTVDASLVNAIFEESIPFNRVVVYLQLEGGDVEQDDAIDRLFKRYKRLTPGRLYTVTVPGGTVARNRPSELIAM